MWAALTFAVLLVAGCGGKQQPAGKGFDEDLPLRAATPAPPPTATTVLDNTTWRPCTGDAAHDVTFVQAGLVEIGNASCGASRWKLEGSRVTFDCNNFTRYEASIVGDEIKGTFKSPKEEGVLCLRRIEAVAVPSKGQGKTIPMTTKAPTTTTRTTAKPREDPRKPIVTPDLPPAPKPSCGPGEHEYMGRCGTCPPLSTYVGNGKCRETMKIPRECSEYANPKPPACR